MPSTRSSKRQTRLAFTPLPSSPSHAFAPSSGTRPLTAAVRYDNSESPTKKQRVSKTAVLAGPSSPRTPRKREESLTFVQDPEQSLAMQSPFKPPWSAPKRRSYNLPTPDASSQLELHLPDSGSNSSDTDSSVIRPKALTAQRSTPPSARRKKNEVLPRTTTDTGIRDDQDLNASIRSSKKHAVVTPTKRRRSKSSSVTNPLDLTASSRPNTRSSLKSSIAQEDGMSSDSTFLSIEDLMTPRRTSKQVTNIVSEDDSDVIITHRTGRTSRKTRSELAATTESDDSDDVVVSPSKRKRFVRSAEHSPRLKTSRRQDDEDLEEDLEILQDTELRSERTRGKVVSSSSKRSVALEALKARRTSQKVIELSSDSENLPTAWNQGQNSESANEVGSSEDEDSGTEAIRQAIRDDDAEYDEDFVDDDDADTLGAPSSLEEIPLEFTRHAHKKIKEHFKDVVEWMVHKKLNPAFPRADPVYQVAFYKLNDEVKGYAGSKFLSSAWMGDFARAIKARPEFHEAPLPPDVFRPSHHCDACNRTNRPAAFIITFGGKAYHPETLEKLSEDDENEAAESDDDAKSRDALGNVLPSTEKDFCKKNAEIAHSLLHWRYSLNDWVLDFLRNEGYTTPGKIVQREDWSIKKRSDYANKVVDEMEEKGEIRALYRDFENQLDVARNFKPERYRGR